MNISREMLERLKPEAAKVPLAEQWRDAAAAAVAVLAVVWLSSQFPVAPPFVVAALGASTALVFALPASPLAQPWSVVGGYLVSALAGVAAAHWIPYTPLAAAVAVGAGTAGMLALRCFHPPGGAVALFAVIGGDKVTSLGFGYVLSPVLANALLLVAAALVVNNLLPGRHYPRRAPEAKPGRAEEAPIAAQSGFNHADLRAAIAAYGRPLYIGDDELDEIITLAERNARKRLQEGSPAADSSPP